MKIMFMGTPEIAVCCMDALAGSHSIVCAVTRADKPKGRGKAVSSSEVKQRALELGIDVVQPTTLKDGKFYEILEEYTPDVIVVVAYGLILPKYVLNYPKYGCINLHASLLPKYRGAAPIQWCLVNGETVGGVTTMQMDEGLDTGDILLRAEVDITPKMTGGELHDIYCEVGAQLLLDTLYAMERGEITPQKQQGESSYASMLTNDNTRIDWNKTAKEICDISRAMDPYPAAHTMLNGKKLKVFDCSPATDIKTNGAAAASIIPDKARLLFVCGDGIVEVGELQLEGKKRMRTSDFLRGYRP